MAKHEYTNWLSDSDYNKLKFHTESQIRKLLEDTYSMHGYKDFALGASTQIMELVEQSWKAVRGRDVPIAPKKKRKER